MNTDITGLNMETEFDHDWGRWQTEDETAELARVADCFKNVESVIKSIEQMFSVELTETRESLEFIKSAYYRR